MTSNYSNRAEASANATQLYKTRHIINDFWQSIDNSKHNLFPEQTIETIQQTTLEFICSGRSINELLFQLKNKGIQINRYVLECFMVLVNDLVHEIVSNIDRFVMPLITTIEVDETFKGDEIKFFEAMDHCSGYLLALNLIQDARYETLYPFYERLLQGYPNIQFILSDLAPVYPRLISQLGLNFNKEIEHIQCQVHAVRNILKEMWPIFQKFTKETQHLRSLSQALETIKSKRTAMMKSIRYYKNKLTILVQARIQLQKASGVRAYQKNMLTHHPQLKALNGEINAVRSTIRGKENALESYNNKRDDLEQQICLSKRKKNVLWYEYMTHRKMFTRFIEYCKHSIASLREFSEKIKNYRKKSCKAFAKYLVRFATHNSSLFTLHQFLDDKIKVNRLISTNRIESFNNWLKRYKDSRRNWQDTKLTSLYTNLIRLHFNVTRRFNNGGNNLSPIERLGFSLHGRSLYDLIFKRFRLYSSDVSNNDFEIGTSKGRLVLNV